MAEKESSPLVNISPEVKLNASVDLGDDPLGAKAHAGGFWKALESGLGAAATVLLHRPSVRAQIGATKDTLGAYEEMLEKGYSEETSAALLGLQGLNLQRYERKIAVAQYAIGHMNGETESGSPASVDLDPDWLNQFWRYAEDVSNEDIKKFLGMLLARSAQGRVQTNKRMLHIVSTLEPEDAALLQRLSGFTFAFLGEDGSEHCSVISGFNPHSFRGDSHKEFDEINERMHELIGDAGNTALGPAGIYVQSGFAGSLVIPNVDGVVNFCIGARKFQIEAGVNPVPDAPDVKGKFFPLGGGRGFSDSGAKLIKLIASKPDADLLAMFRSLVTMAGLNLIQLDGWDAM